jgi:hypothetical protein
LKANKNLQLTESNRFYNKYFLLDKTVMFDHRGHFHRRNIAGNPSATSYRWRTNRIDPTREHTMWWDEKKEREKK